MNNFGFKPPKTLEFWVLADANAVKLSPSTPKIHILKVICKYANMQQHTYKVIFVNLKPKDNGPSTSKLCTVICYDETGSYYMLNLTTFPIFSRAFFNTFGFRDSIFCLHN